MIQVNLGWLASTLNCIHYRSSITCLTVLKQTEKELQKCQQEIDEYETRVEGMSNLLKKKNEDEKSMIMTLKLLQKKIEKLQKQNDEVGEMSFFYLARMTETH